MRIRRQARLSVNLLVMARYTAQGKTSDEILGDFEAGAMDADYGGSTTEYMQAAVTAGCRSGAGTVGQGGGSRSVRQHGRGDRGGRGGDSPLGAETLGVQLANAFPHKAGVRSSSLPPRHILFSYEPRPQKSGSWSFWGLLARTTDGDRQAWRPRSAPYGRSLRPRR